VDGLYAASLSGFIASLYTAKLAGLETRLQGLSGTQAARLRVQQGILQAMFGRLSEAGLAFETARKEDPGLVAPYVNLANVLLVEKKAEAALAVIRDGLARSPGSLLLNLAAARCWALKGDRRRAAEHLAKVRASDPALADRYALILSVNPGSPRAADEGERPAALLWGGGE
jgi:tetratricopeptide (TPR) repeat protein